MISEVKLGAVFIKDMHSDDTQKSDNVKNLAVWPENALKKTHESMSDVLHGIAKDVIDGRTVTTNKMTCDLHTETSICDTITLPIHYANEIIGAVIFLQSVRSEEQKKAVLQLFQWGCAWLESTLATAQEEQNQLNPLTLKLTKLALQDVPVALSAHQICNLLAQELGCIRVALGKVKGLHIHTLALSEQLRFDVRSSQVHQMEAAMEEAMDQKRTIVYPASEEMDSPIIHKHQVLSQIHQDASVLSLPFFNAAETVGVILLIRSRRYPFTEHERTTLESAIKLLGSVLTLKLQDEDSFLKILLHNVKKKIKPLLGAGQLRLKLLLLAFTVGVASMYFIKIPYYAYAKSSLEGAIQQVIVAPQNGFIKSAYVRAGDSVKAGQVLVRLNDSDLVLEREKLHSERDKTHKEYREALALRERSNVSILSAQIAQIDAQLGLVDEKIQRSQLKAPFSGIVVSGDLSQSLGAPVEKGDLLFEIAPLGDYRVALSIDDHDVSKLKLGQTGSLRLVGLPYDPLPVTLSRIIPVASAKDGGNYFRVEATFADKNDTRLRPGMQGITKVQIAQESALWVWTHTLTERLRLWLWSIGL